MKARQRKKRLFLVPLLWEEAESSYKERAESRRKESEE